MPILTVNGDMELQIDDNGTIRTLNIDDLNTILQGAATEATLSDVLVALSVLSDLDSNTDNIETVLNSILTELGQKLEVADLSALATEVKLEQVRALLAEIESNTDNLELSLSDLDINTDDLETSLSNLFTELGQKLETGDIVGLATSAKQDTQITRLEQIRDKDYATETTVGKKFAGGKISLAQQISNLGDNIIIACPVGEKIQLLWLGMSTSENNTSEVLTVVKFGSFEHYRWNLGVPGAFAHWEPILGDTNEDLVINLSGAIPVEVNYTYQII